MPPTTTMRMAPAPIRLAKSVDVFEPADFFERVDVFERADFLNGIDVPLYQNDGTPCMQSKRGTEGKLAGVSEGLPIVCRDDTPIT